MKLVIIHAIFLILCQLLFHHFNAFPELKELTQYEGVTKENFSKVLETFHSP
ncbi:YpfB family protein [Caldibacillus thermoamylovorans]|nr:YpfB family protein [Caldibacillus thermoamylovorans]MCM3798659.1 YpfB family protein [Caldibacillus thermoamylovorans]